MLYILFLIKVRKKLKYEYIFWLKRKKKNNICLSVRLLVFFIIFCPTLTSSGYIYFFIVYENPVGSQLDYRKKLKKIFNVFYAKFRMFLRPDIKLLISINWWLVDYSSSLYSCVYTHLF